MFSVLQSTDDELAGSTLLQVLDNFALNNYNGSEGLPSESTPDNIGKLERERQRQRQRERERERERERGERERQMQISTSFLYKPNAYNSHTI